ncbi:hypothetical protein [Jiulongibacter sediminis]|jgi:hypothetical protein|uniref:hypothetical protein n=1 Tax=Jiulongibacter sediminis TaxID=1605367 RepID=UPI0026EB1EFE|nr:hypothetical protein [Jiulongibacter sediminis]
MKKISILVLILFASFESHACDICGCVNGGSFFGILPQGHMQFAGIRYRQNSFDSHIGSTLLEAQEIFRTTELWARLYPLPKVQLMAFLPYQQNEQNRFYDDFKARLEGVGDAQVLLHYNLLNTFVDTTRLHQQWNHQLMAGFGVKAPLGDYQYDQYDVAEVANANFQLGTGSWDVPLNLIYTLKKHDNGLNINLMYNINGTNANGYHFANQTLLSLLAFRSEYIGNANLVISTGTNSEIKGQDLVNGERNEFTGGWYINGVAGVDLYWKKFGLSVNGQLPIVQNLSNQELKLNQGFTVSLSRTF